MENDNNLKEENKEDNIFFERPFELVDDGYIDERGFYMTPNGSFWDEEHNYFNRYGYDKHGGYYDKFGVYFPGKDYDEEYGLYEDEKNLFDIPNDYSNELKKNSYNTIDKLKKQQAIDEIIIKNFDQPINDSDSYDSLIENSNNENNPNENQKNHNNENTNTNIDEDNSNNSYIYKEIEDVYNDIINQEQSFNQSQNLTQSFKTDSNEFNFFSSEKKI